MTEQPPSIERFRVRIVPATVVVAFGCLLMFMASMNVYALLSGDIARDKRVGADLFKLIATQASLLAIAGVLCFATAWLVLKNRWIATGVVGLLICALLFIVNGLHQGSLRL